MRIQYLVMPLLCLAPAFAQQAARNNAEMDAICVDDQKDHDGDAEPSDAEWEKIVQRDVARRKRVREMVTAGVLSSADDFEKAASIAERGDRADDQLFAHVLAIVALTKGDRDAKDIAVGTLDRYLQKSGKAQVFGTQYKKADNKPWTQEPFDRNLVPDAVRTQLRVPALATQTKHLQDKNKR